jgi:hypothetical protein
MHKYGVNTITDLLRYSSVFPRKDATVNELLSTEEKHGWRYSTHVQRLRARLYLHRCGSGVLFRAWLLHPKKVQVLPSGKEERPTGRRRCWLSFRSCPGHARHLLGMRPTHHRTVRASRRSPRLLQGLLPGPQRKRRRRRLPRSRALLTLHQVLSLPL